MPQAPDGVPGCLQGGVPARGRPATEALLGPAWLAASVLVTVQVALATRPGGAGGSTDKRTGLVSVRRVVTVQHGGRGRCANKHQTRRNGRNINLNRFFY